MRCASATISFNVSNNLMAQRSEIATVYAAGLAQGIALVTFPAAGAIFTSANGYDLSNAEYGAIFEPEAILAIVASLLGAGLTSRLGVRRIYLLGLVANLLAISLLLASKFVMTEHATAFGMLLAATTFLGLGFGLTVPSLNTFAAAFFPSKVDEAILALNALLGLGTALAPVFIAVFVALGIWWGLPLLVGVLLLIVLLFSFAQPLNEGALQHSTATPSAKIKFPARFWLFAAFALLYGVGETVNGNWASLFMLKSLGASTVLASAALALFWGTVTAGRILFTVTAKWLPETIVFRLLPLVMAASFILCGCLRQTNAIGGLLTFALAGLGCSALLPLTISFGQKEMTSIAGSVAGGLITFYEIGYAIAAFGVGPLQTRAGMPLSTIFGASAAVAILMAFFSLIIVRPEKQPIAQISNANT
jgi:fucose permease